DGKITLGEIAQGKLKVTGAFDGDVQAFLPLTTDPNHVIDPNNLGPKDALVIIGGKLSNITNIAFNSNDPGAPADPSDPLKGDELRPAKPLAPSKLDASRFVIYVHHLSTFLQGAISFDNLVNGLDKLMDQLQSSLDGKVVHSIPFLRDHIDGASQFIDN